MQEMMSEDTMEDKGEKTPFDSILERVKSYADDPKLATKETLTALYGELSDLKSVVDGEESDEMEEHDGKGAGLTIVIGKAMKRGGGKDEA